jgi:hypothetical protein
MANSAQLSVGTTWDGRPLPQTAVVHIELHLDADGLSLSFDAPHYDDPLPGGDPGPTWGLWGYEVVEVFLCGPDEHYTEIEIGPAGHFLVLRLQGRRQVVKRVEELALSIEHADGRWKAMARLGREHLPPGPYTLNAYAISGVGEARRYSAAYPRQGEAPDFHALEAFRAW